MHSIPSFVSILFSFFRRVLVLFRQFSNVVGSSVDKVPFQWARYYNNNNRSKPVHLQQQSIISVPLPSTAAASLVDDKNIIDPPVSKITNSFVSFSLFFFPSCSSTFRPFHERRRPFCSLLTIRCHGYCFLVDGFEWYYYGISIVVSAPTTTYLSCWDDCGAVSINSSSNTIEAAAGSRTGAA